MISSSRLLENYIVHQAESVSFKAEFTIYHEIFRPECPSSTSCHDIFKEMQFHSIANSRLPTHYLPRPYKPPQPKVTAQVIKPPATSQQAAGSNGRSSSSFHASPNDKVQSLSDIVRERKMPLFGLALVTFGLSYYIGTLGVSLYRSSLGGDKRRLTAAEHDTALNLPEWLMGITTLRAKLARKAKGSVLEPAVGTGRNVVYFKFRQPTDAEKAGAGAEGADDSQPGTSPIIPEDVVHYTGVDIDDTMLAIAIRRARRYCSNLMVNEHSFRLLHGDVSKALPPPPDSKSKKYDTVIQTFGLCSVEDPVDLIKNLASMVKPNFGRILLLEHGRGTWGFVNRLLDSHAHEHHDRHACWWNRDIVQIIHDAVDQVPGLEIRSLERPGWLQAGTLVMAELRLKQTPMIVSASADANST